MKFIYGFLFCAFSLCLNAQSASVKNFSIYFPPDFPSETKTDIIGLLNQASAGKWKVISRNDENANFILEYKENPRFKTAESFRLQSDGSSRLILSASTTKGLVFGIYSYLRKLGFKFYLPDELYTIVPSIANPFGEKKDAIDKPFLQIRDFFGTGGLGSGLTDPDKSVEKAWNLWKMRNGFGAAYGLSGHRGENFILENKDLLEKHPDWLASPLKTNGQIDVTAKLNYLNKAALDYYINWTIQPLKNEEKTLAPNVTEFVSIEPSDAGGYLYDPSNKIIPSVSDQVFGAANLAAAQLDKLFPDKPNIGVNLYAYSTHAEPPSFSLHHRVFVQIIPYQFQNIAYGPAFIKRWSTKATRFGLYDYFKYADSYWDMPAGYPLDEVMVRAIYAAKAGSEGTTYETSYSKFATGIPLWILVQYMNGGDANWEKNYEQLIVDLYGTSAQEIKKLFKLFYRDPQFGLPQLGTAAQYIQQAEKENTNRIVAERIHELKLYLAYVQLYFESQNEKTGNLEQRFLTLGKMAWTLYEKRIVNGYRIMQLVAYTFLNAKPADPKLADHYYQLHLLIFPETNNPDAFWKKDYKYSGSEIDDIYNRIATNHNSASTNLNVTTVSEAIQASKALYRPTAKTIIQSNYTVRGYFNLFAEKPTTIKIDWKLENKTDPSPFATISGSNLDYSSVYDYPIKGTSGKISISLPKGELFFFIHASTNTTYTLRIELNGVYCYFVNSPRGIMGFIDEQGNFPYTPPIYPTYFYVPEKVNEVQYKVQDDALKIFDPNGKLVTTKLISNQGSLQTRSFTPLPNQTGKFWKAVVSGPYNYQFLNIPDRYFLFVGK